MVEQRSNSRLVDPTLAALQYREEQLRRLQEVSSLWAKQTLALKTMADLVEDEEEREAQLAWISELFRISLLYRTNVLPLEETLHAGTEMDISPLITAINAHLPLSLPEEATEEQLKTSSTAMTAMVYLTQVYGEEWAGEVFVGGSGYEQDQ